MEDVVSWIGGKLANTPTTMTMTTTSASISEQQGASGKASSEAVDVGGLVASVEQKWVKAILAVVFPCVR
jgi:hypothetical protein